MMQQTFYRRYAGLLINIHTKNSLDSATRKPQLVDIYQELDFIVSPCFKYNKEY